MRFSLVGKGDGSIVRWWRWHLKAIDYTADGVGCYEEAGYIHHSVVLPMDCLSRCCLLPLLIYFSTIIRLCRPMTEDVVNKICRQICTRVLWWLKCVNLNSDKIVGTWNVWLYRCLRFTATFRTYEMSDRTVSHIFGGEGGNKEERWPLLLQPLA